MLAAAPDVGDAGVGVEHLERLGLHALEPLAAEFYEGRRVVLGDPRQRVLTGHVLEPEEGVSVSLVIHGLHCGRRAKVG
ncbi:hypothetical protein GCM10023114_55650 [Mycolicibacterium sediminis]|uniref:Uncharacterized protein n=1 Tax=Mycolicibacterium sediminis TaxID=1286180 RepID=A0A7I7QNM8_9MYCO|nr:hypothetical protein MSEDJ_19780 [Mycolicibacterium sediminis]